MIRLCFCPRLKHDGWLIICPANHSEIPFNSCIPDQLTIINIPRFQVQSLNVQLFDLSLQVKSPNAQPEINKHYTLSHILSAIGHSVATEILKSWGLGSYDDLISPAGTGPRKHPHLDLLNTTFTTRTSLCLSTIKSSTYMNR